MTEAMKAVEEVHQRDSCNRPSFSSDRGISSYLFTHADTLAVSSQCATFTHCRERVLSNGGKVNCEKTSLTEHGAVLFGQGQPTRVVD
jgi:hypothetical protein